MITFIKSYLEAISPVPFNLTFKDETCLIGKGTPQFTVTLHKKLDTKLLLSSTSLALGEAYMKKELEVDRDLFEVLDLFLRSMDHFKTDASILRKLLSHSTTKRNQKHEVQSHYDIGNDFYKLWLDKSMSYSCAYFKTDNDTLDDAQINKVDHILSKLYLKPDMTLLDIGCGWGFLLKRAVKLYHVKGVGITLSKEQYDKFSKEIIDEGLSEQLEVKLLDYRDMDTLPMTFDRVVSVGMLEHVGRTHYDLFISKVNAVLKPQGLFLLHYISGLSEHPGDPWIEKYIFPGGMIPSLREIITLLPKYHFYTLDIESLRRHYMKTLLCWRNNFLSHKEEILKMQGEEFTRMWELYLSSCAATFHNGIIDLHQILISKGVNNTLPMIRSV